MGEVDQFLDEVEAELARLTKENDDLRSKLSAAQTGSAPAPRPHARARAGQGGGEARPGRSPGAPWPRRPPPPPRRCRDDPGRDRRREASNAAARLLELATRNADELVDDAKNEADKIVGAARTKAERLEAESKTKADRLEADARSARRCSTPRPPSVASRCSATWRRSATSSTARWRPSARSSASTAPASRATSPSSSRPCRARRRYRGPARRARAQAAPLDPGRGRGLTTRPTRHDDGRSPGPAVVCVRRAPRARRFESAVARATSPRQHVAPPYLVSS